MAEFINTADVIGDDALTDGIIEKSITEFNDNVITLVGDYAFRDCNALTSVCVPSVTKVGGYAFSMSEALRTVDLTSVITIAGYAFQVCSALTALILRNTSALPSLLNKDAISYTAIASGAGYIYVPRNLVDSYKQSTNWSTYAAQFRALEDYTVDGTITGELDPTKI